MIQAAIKRFFRSWAHQTQLQFATTSVLIGTFTVLMMAWSIFQSMGVSLRSFGDHIQMTAYLVSEQDAASTEALLSRVEKIKQIESVRYVSAAEAIVRFKEQMKDHLPEMFFQGEFENPLPATLEIEISEELIGEGREKEIREVVNELKALPGIEDVSFGFNWASQFSRVTRAFTVSGSFLILILLMGGLFVIGNSVNQSVFQRRDEIELMELFGATRRAILVPFIVEGMLTGLIAGTFALILSAIAMGWLQSVVVDEMGFIGVVSELGPLGWKSSILALIICSALGGLGAWIFVNRITTGWAAAQRGPA